MTMLAHEGTPRSSWLPDWGPWRLYPETLVLVPLGHDYEVDLEECTTSAEVLDWYHQIAGKGWADDATLAGLVRAVDEVLRPQAHLCSFGHSREISKAKVAALVHAAARRRPDLVHVYDDEP